MRNCDSKPIHGGYPDYTKEDVEREFLDELMNLCVIYGFRIVGEIFPEKWENWPTREYTLRDGQIVTYMSNLKD